MRAKVSYVAVTISLLVLGCSAPASTDAPRAHDEGAARARAAAPTKVLAISVDGLNPRALIELGDSRAPVFHRLLRQGASTLNARTEREMTVTLPNHTGMVTSRRVDADKGGHGVTWNDLRPEPSTVQEAAGHPVSSVFKIVAKADHSPALFAAKPKFRLFKRSWSGAVDKVVIRQDNAVLTRKVRQDLSRRHRTFTFLHLSKPDIVGHEKGFMSPAYLDAVADVDGMLGRILRTIKGDPRLNGRLAIVLTADHGGKGPGHSNPRLLTSYRVPFIIWGPGVARGKSLYDLNSDYANPGKSRTRYSDPLQPVRNGDLGNVVTDLLGLRAIPGSEHDVQQDLDWR